MTRPNLTGIELFEFQQSQVVSKKASELKELPSLSRTVPIETLEKTIHAQLETTRVDARVDLLVNRLAIAQLSSIFERAYGAIYGSQITGLRELLRAGGTVTKAQALEFFNEAKSNKSELSKVEFSGWLEFLRAFNLIKAENETISISDLGRDFLLYLTAQNLNEAKPG